jgi:hypothetical protein
MTNQEVITGHKPVSESRKNELLMSKNYPEDGRTGEEYLRLLINDDFLHALVNKNRSPRIDHFGSHAIVIFPASPMMSRHKNLQTISRVVVNANGPLNKRYRYVQHTTTDQLKGPKTICSYVVISSPEALEISQRVVDYLKSASKISEAIEYLKYAIRHDQK